MIASILKFALAILIFFPVYWFVLKQSIRHYAILLLSVSMYIYFYPSHAPVLIFFSLSVFVFGEIIKKNLRFPVLHFSVVFCVFMLALFKYSNLIVLTINDALGILGVDLSFKTPDLDFPPGISFLTFAFIHYLVDTSRKRVQNIKLSEFGAYSMFYPTIISGPIKRIQPFLSQLREKRSFRPEYAVSGLSRIITGLGKKVIIADTAGIYALPLLQFTSDVSVKPATLWISVFAFAIKIYFDFSGYTDIAIGCAKLFGYDIPENFKSPYLKQNIAQFWNSWHITLSTWLRDYVYMSVGKKYMPVLGRKHPLILAGICNFVTMGVCGIWHGASWNFLVWGLYHGAGLSIHRAFASASSKKNPSKKKKLKTSTLFFKRLVFTAVTFGFVCIGWIFFVLPVSDSILVLREMFFVEYIINFLAGGI